MVEMKIPLKEGLRSRKEIQKVLGKWKVGSQKEHRALEVWVPTIPGVPVHPWRTPGHPVLQTLPQLNPAKYKPISNSCDLTLQFLPPFSGKNLFFRAGLVKTRQI